MSTRHAAALLGVALVLAAAAAGGQSTGPPEPTTLRYERAVWPGDRGPNRLALDPAVIAGGRPFRVFDRRAEDGLTDFRDNRTLVVRSC